MENTGFDFKDVREGAVVKGKVVRKSDGDLFLDINYKAEGLIPKEETVKYTYYDSVKEGDEMEVFVKRSESKEGFVILSKIIADKKEVFSRVKEASKDGKAIEGRVVKTVKGGYIIDFGANVTAFLPLSHAKTFGTDVQDRMIPLKIIQFDEEKRNIVVSHREYMNDVQKAEAEAVKSKFPVNEKIEVKVLEAKPEGVRIEREGVEGFIPLEELSWRRIEDTAVDFPVGTVLTAIVTGNEKGRAVLSVKRAKDNPYKQFMEEKKQGDHLTAKVKKILDEGMVVEIENDAEAFIHKSELSYLRRINSIAEVYKQGDTIETCVSKFDEAKGRIFLSVKRLDKNPWPAMDERYPAGARVVGTVKAVTEGEGANIELEENVEAFLGTEDISWFSFAKIEDVLKIGEKKEFRILEVDKNKQRLVLGLKQLLPAPWTSFLNKFKEGSFIDVKISEIEDAALVCGIVEGVSGRIPIKNRAKLTVKKGDMVKAKIMKIDKDAKKVTLAAGGIEITEEKKQIDDYMKTHEHSFKMNDVINFGNVNKEGQDK